MKSLPAIVVSFVLSMSLLSCCGTSEVQTLTTDLNNIEEQREQFGYSSSDMPKECCAVIFVRINPEFRLYLDAEMNILKVDSLNEDAKNVLNEIAIEGLNFDIAVTQIVSEAYQQGFLSDGKNIEISVEEIVNDEVSAIVKTTLVDAETAAVLLLDEKGVASEVYTAIVEEEAQKEQASTPAEEQIICKTCDGDWIRRRTVVATEPENAEIAMDWVTHRVRPVKTM
ncbi:MAG: hypothetical protein K6G30_14775 [Acetatifactor sp.]|nr:hypothetical protein [Acetatifactor sp.]